MKYEEKVSPLFYLRALHRDQSYCDNVISCHAMSSSCLLQLLTLSFTATATATASSTLLSIVLLPFNLHCTALHCTVLHCAALYCFPQVTYALCVARLYLHFPSLHYIPSLPLSLPLSLPSFPCYSTSIPALLFLFLFLFIAFLFFSLYLFMYSRDKHHDNTCCCAVLWHPSNHLNTRRLSHLNIILSSMTHHSII